MEKEQSQNRDAIALQKLRQIVLDHIQDEQFGVEELARAYGISRSQLHRKLKKLTKKSISRFIREIRLDKAHELLKEDAGTVSEIAYGVGFSSATYFNTCYRDYFGYPPGEAKFHKEPIAPNEMAPKLNKKRKTILIGLSAVLLLAVAWLAFSTYTNMPQEIAEVNDSSEKSIAILPFKNWTGDPEKEYISDGMTDAVITRLTEIHEIDKVVPFTSMLPYKETAQSIPELATALNVTHIMEGSFQYFGGDFKLTYYVYKFHTGIN